MADNLEFDTELQTLRENAIDRFLTAEVFDSRHRHWFSAFAVKPDIYGRSILFLSKFWLARDASSAIRSRAEYVPLVRLNAGMVHRFDMLLDLMMIG